MSKYIYEVVEIRYNEKGRYYPISEHDNVDNAMERMYSLESTNEDVINYEYIVHVKEKPAE